MMTVTYILAAVVLLGLCIFVHELGHLLGGKMVGIKARTFSLGYGKGVFKKKFGDTTYQVTLIPFGGYCQFYGEDPNEERSGQGFEFLSAHPLKRMVTVVMGPLFNLFFGVLLFFAMNIIGYTQETNRIYIPEPLRSESSLSPAYAAGLRSGDEIVAINGKPIRGFTDIQAGVIFSDGETLDFAVKRDGRAMNITVTPSMQEGSGRYTIGVMPYGSRILIAGVMHGDVADNAGIKEMDEIISVDSERMATPHEFTEYIKTRANKEIMLSVKRGDETLDITLKPRINTVITLREQGKGEDSPYTVAAFDTSMLEKSHSSGQLALNGVKHDSFKDFMNKMSGLNEQKITLEKDGSQYSGRVSIDRRGFIGVYPALSPDMIEVRYGVVDGFTQALVDPYDFIVMNIKGMGMLFSGEMNVRENISGPIRIAKIAGDVAYYKGVSAFIILMAKISIILMVMNLLPIPAVDGSHLIFYTIELIRGKPLSEELMGRIQTAGVILLIVLGAFIIVNDISMLPFVQRLMN